MVMTPGELAQLRTDQKTILPDTCKVTRAAVQGAFNENTGDYAAAGPTTIHNGPCRAVPISESERTLVFGERAVDIVAFVVTLPFDVAEVKENDTVEMTASTDPQFVGTIMAVRHIVETSIMTARRVIAEMTQ